MKYVDVEAHNKECDYQQVNCKNQGCEEKGLQIDIKIHENSCQLETKECTGCEEILTLETESDHNCTAALNSRLKMIESMVRKLCELEEIPRSESDNDQLGALGPLKPRTVRFSQVAEYNVPVIPYVPLVNSYEFDLPDTSSLPSTISTLILRIKVMNTEIGHYLTTFKISQTGNDQFIDLLGYIIPKKGDNQVFELLLPFSEEGIGQVSIQMTGHAHYFTPQIPQQSATMPQYPADHLSSAGSQSEHIPHSSHGQLNLYDGSSTNHQQQQHQNPDPYGHRNIVYEMHHHHHHAMPAPQPLYHNSPGYVYIGIAGYMS